MSWLITGSQKIDPDAAVYLSRVEAADGQTLEPDVRTAVEAFIVGCKADGIWNAIKASCILAGARTLAGALVPLVGTAPTNNGFIGIGTDYERKTGLVGNGSTKYLNSNQPSNAHPQNSIHFCCYITAPATTFSIYMATRFINSSFEFNELQLESSSTLFVYNRSGGGGGIASISGSNVTGLFGSNRNESSGFSVRSSGSTATRTNPSFTPRSDNFTIFARNQSPPAFHSNGRLAFYSIGESLDLALLDARVTTLVNAFAAAIP